jgi:DMSO reductase family type II enzyme molybdopterin subunit
LPAPSDDLFYSDLILIWGGNPIYTQIPNAHFMLEARYHGAQLITIAPDYSASAVHADEWVPVEIGTDAALALAFCQVMVEENLVQTAFVKEQTDLPLLVRKDNQHYLRQSDLEKGGHADRFYCFDKNRGTIAEVNQKSLALEGSDPALDGEYQVTLADGRAITVEPVYQRLVRQLADYTPEKASRITGTRPAQIRSLARRIAKAKAACMICHSNFGKFYHGMEMERAQILVFTLSGQIGKKGSGIVGFPYLSLAGIDALNMADGNYSPKMAIAKLGLSSAADIARLKIEGLTNEMMLYEMGRDEYREGSYVATALWLYQHGGMKEIYGSSQQFDPHMQRTLDDYMKEAVSKGWQLASTHRPRILMECGGNLVRRVRSGTRLLDTLWPKLDLVVTFDWRMSTTALNSDYVLPAAGWYEKDDITWATPITPFAHATTRAVEPLGESLNDWEFHCILAKTLQNRAIERNILTYWGREGGEKRFDNIYDLLTFGQRFTEKDTEKMLEEMLSVTTNLNGITWKELKAKGYERFTDLGMAFANIGNATDIKPNETITANTWHTEKKLPWPTLSRRMQFYIDQDFYLELGEALPVHKDNPAIGGNYPLKMTGGHTRWSIHASWRDEKHLLQLQRGEPVIYIGMGDAAARNIADGDRVKVRNDFGELELQAKLTPALRPGQVVVYHAWEPFQFKNHQSHQSLLPSPINPVQLAGGHFHLQPMMIAGEPGLSDRGTRVEVERI